MRILVAFLASLLAVAANALPLLQLRFTRSDGTIWQTKVLAPYPENPMFLGQSDFYRGLNGIGTHTNLFNGSYYSIDTASNKLLKNGLAVGQLRWYLIGTNYVVLDVQNHHGFAIDNQGRGWLAAQENDGDPRCYLWRVDLTSGQVFYVDYISSFEDPENMFTVNGMIVIDVIFFKPVPRFDFYAF
jgi:hypothetical protein